MEEEKETRSAPPRFNYKLIKIATLTLLFLAIFFFAGFFGLEATSSSKFCSSCHEMKPEYYTWKASTHSEVDCVNCHIEPGVKNLAEAKAGGVKELYKKQTDTYLAPIQMPKDIPNSACERCHNMDTREVTTSGDLIIPHDKHLAKDIECVQCHSGVAHGKIAERKVTFKSDYGKWDDSLGKSMMSDIKFTSPKMETCMECHEARQVTTECKACHTTSMYPKSHKKADFKDETHGSLAIKDVKKCNECHKYMSKKEIDIFNEKPASMQYLNNGTVKEDDIDANDYAKQNTYCKDCHSTRPASHKKGFGVSHGVLANKNTEMCLTCHDYQNTGRTKNIIVTCNTCHPSTHSNRDWRITHPINVERGRKVTEYCYTCHVKKNCTSCHKE